MSAALGVAAPEAGQGGKAADVKQEQEPPRPVVQPLPTILSAGALLPNSYFSSVSPRKQPLPSRLFPTSLSTLAARPAASESCASWRHANGSADVKRVSHESGRNGDRLPSSDTSPAQLSNGLQRLPRLSGQLPPLHLLLDGGAQQQLSRQSQDVRQVSPAWTTLSMPH